MGWWSVGLFRCGWACQTPLRGRLTAQQLGVCRLGRMRQAHPSLWHPPDTTAYEINNKTAGHLGNVLLGSTFLVCTPQSILVISCFIGDDVVTTQLKLGNGLGRGNKCWARQPKRPCRCRCSCWCWRRPSTKDKRDKTPHVVRRLPESQGQVQSGQAIMSPMLQERA